MLQSRGKTLTAEPTDEHASHPAEEPDSPAATLPGEARGQGPLAGNLGVFIFVILFSTAGYLTYHTLTTAEDPTPAPPPATYMCSETDKTFEHIAQMGERLPVLSPHTNRRTGYPAEMCFWTKDNKRKEEPTYVVLNDYLGKPGPTICPTCDRIITHGNEEPPPDTPLATAPTASPTTD